MWRTGERERLIEAYQRVYSFVGLARNGRRRWPEIGEMGSNRVGARAHDLWSDSVGSNLESRAHDGLVETTPA
jgi:hypothetical protein